MTTEHDFDRITRAWLDLMPDEAPDRTVQAVLQAVEAMPQLHPLRPAVRRNPPVHRLALVAAVAALTAALAGGAIFLAGGEATLPTTTSSPSNQAEPSRPEAVPGAIRAVWTRGIGGYPPNSRRANLVIAGSGASVGLVRGTTDLALRSSASAVAADEFELVLVDDDGECLGGDVGHYRWSLDEAGGVLTLLALSDACDDRRGSLEGTWARSHLGRSDGGPGVVDAFDPVFAISLPPGSYQHRKLPGTVELSDPAQNLAVSAWLDPRGFADPCSGTQRAGLAPGADAFVEYVRESGAYTNVTTEEFEIDGHRAVNLEFDARPDGVCPPGQGMYYLLVPTAMDLGARHVAPGEHDSYWIVEFDYATLFLQVLPVGSPHEADIIESLRFP